MNTVVLVSIVAMLWPCYVLGDASAVIDRTRLPPIASNQEWISVNTSVGEIIGFSESVDIDGKQYVLNNFLGIPFAESTSGKRRFQKPVPKEAFTAPFKATSEGSGCLQTKNLIPGKVAPLSEDCLFLNIFVPSGVAAAFVEKKAVMVWIYGGGFHAGYSNAYNADTLSASGDVIVVTLNYRLSPFGFLSTGDSVAPGNYGLWDQHLAIKWIHNNIGFFGGDTSRVTIFGESAGAISVLYQALYPGNKGFFQRVIAGSGSVTTPKEFTQNPLEYTKLFAKVAGCEKSDIGQTVDCLRAKSEQEMDRLVNDPTNGLGYIMWAPVLDGEIVKVAPSDIFKNDQVNSEARKQFNSMDLMTGVNSIDGSLLIGRIASELNVKNIDDIDVSRNVFEHQLVPEAITKYFDRNATKEAIKAAVYEYTQWSDPENDDIRRETLVNMTSDYIFNVPAIQTINTHAQNSSQGNSYLYRFSTKPSRHLLPVPSWMEGPNRANHADDVTFIFGFDKKFLDYNFVGSYNVTSRERGIAKMVMTLWSNFAKSGNPNSPVDVTPLTKTKWLPYDTDAKHYLELTPDMTSDSLKQRLIARKYDLWMNLLPSLMKEQ